MLLRLDGTGCLHDQIYRAVRDEILAGRLVSGARLPSSRALAATLGLSRTTVLVAYEQLGAEGYLVTRIGSGTRVADVVPDQALGVEPRPAASEGGRAEPPPPLSAHGRRLVEAGLAYPYGDRTGRRPPFDFLYGVPDVEHFPRELWRRALVRRLREAGSASFGYAAPEGARSLRRELAGYLARSRAVRAEPERIFVTTGMQQTLDLLVRILVDPGDAVVLEDPHYLGARRAFAAAGARIRGVAVDAEGLRVDALADGPAKLVHVTPSHQFPTGAVLGATRRRALLDWARERGAYVLEDDYDSEFRYEGRPIAALQGMDGSGRVVYMGTFSKALFPALRIGYVVVPEALVVPFRAAKWLADWCSPLLEQRVLADFLAEGHFERHLRRAALLAALASEFGGRVRVEGANAGLHVVAWFEDLAGAQVPALVEAARAEGVGVYDVAPYYLRPPERAGLLLGFATMGERAIREGVRRLARAVEGVVR